MNDKDHIKELFQKELGNYKAKVDPSLWKGVQTGLGSASASAGSSSIGLAGKIIIGSSIATALTVGGILWVNNTKKSETKTQKVETTVNSNNSSKTTSTEKEKTIEKPKNESQSIAQDDPLENHKEKKQTNSQQESSSDQVNKDDSSTPLVLDTQVNDENSAEKENHKIQQESNTNQIDNRSAGTTEKETIKDNKEQVVDLSKVEIQIVDQKNQFVRFASGNVPEGATIEWDFGDGDQTQRNNPEHFYSETGKYNVDLTVMKNQEKITKSVTVSIDVKGEIGSLPNVFTPNGDGKNDVFFIESKHLKSFQLTVMDKNQKVIYTTNNPNFKWKGLDQSGKPVEEGNYIYIIVATDESGNTINKYQKLTLQR